MTHPSRRPDAASLPHDSGRSRETLARKWSYLLSGVVVVAMSRDELDVELDAQLDVLCEALRTEPFDPAPFERLGERLVALGYVNGPGLRCTVDVLGKGLLALEEFQAIEQHSVHVVRGMGALAASFTTAHAKFILDQQESMQRSLLRAARDARWDLRESESRFSEVASSSTSGILIVDLDGRLVWGNAAIGEILGREPEPGVLLRELVAPSSVQVLHDAVEQVFSGRQQRVREPLQMLRGEDDLARVTLALSLLRDGDDRPSHFLVVAEDETELALLQGELRKQTLHDVLTGLPNRQFFGTHLETALRRADPAYGVTVIHLDLDAFGMVCNSLGGKVGERLLQHVAQRLRVLFSREQAMVARFDGDEFGVLVENSATTPALATTMAAINADLAEPTYVDGHGLAVSVSAGVVHRPLRDTDPAELLRAADLAMRRAKRGRRGQWELFHPDQDARDRRDHALAVQMPGAFEQGEISVRYRPIQHIASKEAIAVEALLHWDRPGMTSQRCAELADQTGMILSLGEWLLQVAAGQTTWWRQRGYARPLAVRLTPHQVSDADLVQRVVRVLGATGLPAADLMISMPAAVLPMAEAADNLAVLADMGVRTVLDDFGLGPVDLAVVADLPLWAVRVSQTLVDRPVPHLTALMPLVREAGMKVCVDGITTEEQALWWRDAGADYATGDYVGAAQEPGEFLEPR